MTKLNLQLFADGETAATAAAGVDTGSGAAAVSGTQTDGAQAAEPSFDQLIQGKYRDQYEAAVGQRINAAIQQRFRNQKATQQQYQPIMQALGAKYGVDPSDVDGIAKRLTDDDSLYQEEADRLGVPVSVAKNMRQLQARAEQAEAQNRVSAEQQMYQRHWEKISREADELKKTFPDFDLMAEIKGNERFARMTSPEIGISVKDAYYAIHGEEIQRNSMQYAARQAGKNIAASVQAGASRPRENGMAGNAAADLSVDIAHMDPKQRAAIRQRVKNGEKVTFT